MTSPPEGYRLAVRIFLPRDAMQVVRIGKACPKGSLVSEAQREPGGTQFMDVFEPVKQRREVTP